MSSEERIEREQRLRREVLRGIEDAWRSWYEEASPLLFAYVLWRCARLPQVAEEIAQETWLVAVRRIRSFDPTKGTFQNWLRGIAANLIRNYFRAQRNGAISLNGQTPEATSDHERAWHVADALSELPDRYESVLRAKYLECWTVNEIADAWQETPKAIESLLTRARQAFREAYQPEDENA